LDKGFYFSLEALFAKECSVGAYFFGFKISLHFFKAADGIDNCLFGLLFEKKACFAGQDGVDTPSLPIGNDRHAGTLGLNGGDAKVFLGSEDKAFGFCNKLS
jgi:hypothetical protein